MLTLAGTPQIIGIHPDALVEEVGVFAWKQRDMFMY